MGGGGRVVNVSRPAPKASNTEHEGMRSNNVEIVHGQIFGFPLVPCLQMALCGTVQGPPNRDSPCPGETDDLSPISLSHLASMPPVRSRGTYEELRIQISEGGRAIKDEGTATIRLAALGVGVRWIVPVLTPYLLRTSSGKIRVPMHQVRHFVRVCIIRPEDY